MYYLELTATSEASIRSITGGPTEIVDLYISRTGLMLKKDSGFYYAFQLGGPTTSLFCMEVGVLPPISIIFSCYGGCPALCGRLIPSGPGESDKSPVIIQKHVQYYAFLLWF